MTDDRADHHLEEVIASACCVIAASEDIDSITIVGNRRLTYPEFARVSEHAAPCRVAIAMDGNGTVRVRRRDVMRRPSVGRCRGENEHGSRDSGSHGAR